MAMLDHLSSYLNALYHLNAEHLPSYLITAEMLNETIKDIQDHLSEHNLPFELIYQAPFEFYRNARFAHGFNAGHLFVSLYFDLKPRTEDFVVYEVHTFLIKMQDAINVSMTVLYTPAVLAVTQDRQYYIELSVADLLTTSRGGKYLVDRHVVRHVND